MHLSDEEALSLLADQLSRIYFLWQTKGTSYILLVPKISKDGIMVQTELTHKRMPCMPSWMRKNLTFHASKYADHHHL